MSIPLSDGELAAIRTAAQTFMNTPLTIQRRTTSKGATSNVITGWATVATVNGLLAQPTAGVLANYDYLIGSQAMWQVHVPVGTDIRASDRVLVGGQTMEVQVVLQPQSNPISTRVLATEIKGA
jgi:head-tail adaptor